MTNLARAMPIAAAVLVLAVLLVATPLSSRRALAAEPQVEFASHRAVYELKLAHARGNSSTMAARGRILYDFSGNSCDGYALLFRQVSELDNGEGKVTLSDLRSTSWEEGTANRLVFKSQNYLNENLLDTVDGDAQRAGEKVQVSLTKPEERKFEIEPTVAFPTDHMRRIIAAARQEKSILELPVYDGSEKGDKVFNTLSVIGRAIAATSLAKSLRWRWHIRWAIRWKRLSARVSCYSDWSLTASRQAAYSRSRRISSIRFSCWGH